MSANPTIPTAKPAPYDPENPGRVKITSDRDTPRPHNRGDIEVIHNLFGTDSPNYQDELERTTTHILAMSKDDLANFALSVDRQKGEYGYFLMHVLPVLKTRLQDPEREQRAKEFKEIQERRLTEIDRNSKIRLPRHKSHLRLQGSGITLIVKNDDQLRDEGFKREIKSEDILFLPNHHLESGKPVENKEDYCTDVWTWPKFREHGARRGVNVVSCPRCGQDILQLDPKTGKLEEIKIK